MTKQKSLDARRRDLLARVRTEGAEAAYETALAICRDDKAPAPARATASATIFRVGGYFDRNNSDASEKEPYEMTAEELAQAIERLSVLENVARHDADADGDEEPSLFD